MCTRYEYKRQIKSLRGDKKRCYHEYMKPKKEPKKTTPYQIRLDDETIARLIAAETELSLERADIVRLILRAGLKELEKRGYDIFSFSSQESKALVSYNVSRAEDVALLRETSPEKK